MSAGVLQAPWCIDFSVSFRIAVIHQIIVCIRNYYENTFKISKIFETLIAFFLTWNEREKKQNYIYFTICLTQENLSQNKLDIADRIV